MTHELWVASRVSQAGSGTEGHCDKHETLHSGCGDYCLKVFNVPFEGKIDPLPIGEAAAAPIIANDRVPPRQS